MADERNTSNVPPEPGAKPGQGKRARTARPARAVEGNGLWDRPQLLNLISDVLMISMLIPFPDSAPNIREAVPGLPSIPAPTMETLATSSSIKDAGNVVSKRIL